MKAYNREKQKTTRLKYFLKQQVVAGLFQEALQLKHDFILCINIIKKKQQRAHMRNIYFFAKVQVDLEPNVIDDMKSVDHLDHYSTSTFARGHYMAGNRMIGKVRDQLRKLADSCDNIMGFMMTNSIGGRNRLWFGHVDLGKSANRLPKKKKITKVGCVIYPSHTFSISILEPYNALFGMQWLVNFTDIVLVFDNESIYNICQRNLHIAKPDISNVNRLIAKVISSTTASLRFSGESSADLNELQMSLVAFPRLHFMTTGMSPIVSKMDITTTPNDMQAITDKCFKPTNWLVRYDSFDPTEDKYMSVMLNYRGNVTSRRGW
ncbi:Alpha-tubulin [Reticulomyxa filosa]|uniref:Alpha-tubulin n=1 Tax=Reticulomyxa filosa TaxID=46433 RepID=X6LML2_RETFI|nr:Alpha-tubulin [Reticulomyxa filosa]|eukprot:ETO01950.1 Alpha-tubulin [Reticulomyxa filosa]